MSKKLPAFQLYPGDWRKDPGVQALDYEYRGIWFEMLLLMHESEQRGKLLLNGNPMPDEALARLLGLDIQKLKKVKTTLLDYGVASTCEDTGALMNRRMVRDEEIRRKRAEGGKKGARHGKKGGRPPKNPSKTPWNKKEGVNKKPLKNPPSSSTSSSYNSPSGENAHTREGPVQIDPPQSTGKVVEIGNMRGIPPDQCEVYYHLRATDNFMRQDKNGNWKPILNWHSDLVHLYKKGALRPDKSKKTSSNRIPGMRADAIIIDDNVPAHLSDN